MTQARAWWHTWSRLYWPSHTLAHPKDTGGTGDRQSYSYHLVLGKEGRADKTTKEKKARESITYAIYREKTSPYTQPGNCTWEQEAMLGEGRRQAGPGQAQAQVRWNRLCSLTASLKLKAPHTHTESICDTPHGLQHQPELSSHIT